MAKAWNRVRGNRSQDYTPLPLTEKEPLSPRKSRRARWSRWSIAGLALCITGALLALFGLVRYKSNTRRALKTPLTSLALPRTMDPAIQSTMATVAAPRPRTTGGNTRSGTRYRRMFTSRRRKAAKSRLRTSSPAMVAATQRWASRWPTPSSSPTYKTRAPRILTSSAFSRTISTHWGQMS